MTDITAIDLEALNLKNLQNLAKEYKVKSWWTMKKATLVEALTFIKEEEKWENHATEADVEEKIQKAAKELGIELDPQDEKPSEDKTPHKKVEKSKKVPKVEKNEESLVTIKELASEFKMKSAKARRILRGIQVERPYGSNRWEWDKVEHREILEQVRKALGGESK